ncbi:MAG: hypothetical protein ACW99U_18135 [Candidatus Thorarchaeota archaeon]|jgi:hypothetical protein
MAGLQGCIWIEGDYIHCLAAGGVEYRWKGTLVAGAPHAGIEGSCWVEGNNFHYISANDEERYITGDDDGHVDASIPGSPSLLGSMQTARRE